ncbi:DNA mismatch repair protein MutT [Clostridia bacterium]|nr:DNA mismatch repair protein MutT [Clostridia bacterium]
MISFTIDGGKFNFRAAGLLIHDGKLLIHRGMTDDFYALPGGRVEMFEDTEATLLREFKEEIDADIEIERLLWVCEDFFEYEGGKVHEIGFYYLIKLKEPMKVQLDGTFTARELNDSLLEFKWVPLEEMEGVTLLPEFLKSRLNDLPATIERVVDREI